MLACLLAQKLFALRPGMLDLNNAHGIEPHKTLVAPRTRPDVRRAAGHRREKALGARRTEFNQLAPPQIGAVLPEDLAMALTTVAVTII